MTQPPQGPPRAPDGFLPPRPPGGNQPPPGYYGPPAQPVAPPQPPAPPPRRPLHKAPWFLLLAGGLTGLVLGAAAFGSNGVDVEPAVTPPTTTVTTTEFERIYEAPASPDPGATVTVTTTVTATVENTVSGTDTEAPGEPAETFDDGVFEVGVDIMPGTYSTDGDDCYWARLSAADGEFDSIITNGLGAGIVEVKETDKYFESRRCGPWVQR